MQRGRPGYRQWRHRHRQGGRDLHRRPRWRWVLMTFSGSGFGHPGLGSPGLGSPGGGMRRCGRKRDGKLILHDRWLSCGDDARADGHGRCGRSHRRSWGGLRHRLHSRRQSCVFGQHRHRAGRHGRRQEGAQLCRGRELRRGEGFQFQMRLGERRQTFRLVQHGPLAAQHADTIARHIGGFQGMRDLTVEHLRLVLGLVEIQAGRTGQQHANTGHGTGHAGAVSRSWVAARQASARRRALRARGLARASSGSGRSAPLVSS